MLSRQKTVLAHYVLQSYYFKPQKSCFSRKNNLFYSILLPKINKKKAKANFFFMTKHKTNHYLLERKV